MQGVLACCGLSFVAWDGYAGTEAGCRNKAISRRLNIDVFVDLLRHGIIRFDCSFAFCRFFT